MNVLNPLNPSAFVPGSYLIVLKGCKIKTGVLLRSLIKLCACLTKGAWNSLCGSRHLHRYTCAFVHTFGACHLRLVGMSSSPPHQQHTPCRTYGSMLLHMLREFAWKWLARTLLPAAVVAQLHAAKKYSTNQYAGLATVRLGTFSVDCFQWSPLRWIQKSD
jgi:hypothetical protein